jgi:hypothetical protein
MAYFAVGLLSDWNHATWLLKLMKTNSSEIHDAKVMVHRKRSEHAKKWKQTDAYHLKWL